MTDKNTLAGNNIKDFHDLQKYVYCDLCAMNGYANEKVIFQLKGLRSENQDGFIYKFTTYDYKLSGEKRTQHTHKYNLKLIHELVDLALKGAKVID